LGDFGRNKRKRRRGDLIATTECDAGSYPTIKDLKSAFRILYSQKTAPALSRYLTLAMNKRLLKLRAESSGMRNRSYVPYWA